MSAVRGGTFQTLAGPPDLAPGPDAGAAIQRATTVTVSNFTLDTYEVSVARFRRFWEAGHPAPGTAVAYPGGHSLSPGAVVEPGRDSADAGVARCNWSVTANTAESREEHPINCVDRATALAFCVWDGHGAGRLPTRAEWEFAARGVERVGLPRARDWPWGTAGDTDDVCARGRLGSLVCGSRPGGVDPVGTRPVGMAVAGSAYQPYGGFYDLIGNVGEWTADLRIAGIDVSTCWERETDAGMLTDPLCARLMGTETANEGYLNGASIATSRLSQANPGARSGSGSALAGSYDTGFRCARTVP
ncbi:MAG: formylglycine-generating enzyme family protein [Deltaproteobacteria bacterium]|nr:formylglycine-generating enzyme family protein [Deltaproteobacteria bacterium]